MCPAPRFRPTSRPSLPSSSARAGARVGVGLSPLRATSSSSTIVHHVWIPHSRWWWVLLREILGTVSSSASRSPRRRRARTRCNTTATLFTVQKTSTSVLVTVGPMISSPVDSTLRMASMLMVGSFKYIYIYIYISTPAQPPCFSRPPFRNLKYIT